MNRPKPTFWTGCHGVRLADCALDVGQVSGTPLLDAEVRIEAVTDAPGVELWRLDMDVVTAEGVVSVDQRLYRQPDGSTLVRSTSGQSVAVDAPTGRIAVDGRDDGVRLQLLTTFGLPLVLAEAPVLIVHASACWREGGAVLICAESGRGKSSALVGLTAAGWRAVSEDLCVIDLRADPPVVWPGPPWVRRAHGLAGPAGSAPRFDTPDKTAWDIAPWQVDGPVELSQLVFLDQAGGSDVVDVAVSAPEAVQLLARHALWLGEPDDRGRRLFGPAVDLAARLPARRLRFPVSDLWLDRLLEVLAPGGVARRDGAL
ncbi:MAG TPA: hypothetical protein VFB78_11335 [Acidimicrobiales bacterium]|nr:hypothetical protein [Acidimicrobiales bacterium]